MIGGYWTREAWGVAKKFLGQAEGRTSQRLTARPYKDFPNDTIARQQFHTLPLSVDKLIACSFCGIAKTLSFGTCLL